MLPKTKVFLAIFLLIIFFFGFLIYRQCSHEPVKMPSGEISHEIQEKAWHEFRDPAGGFKVMLPSLPQHASEAVPLPGGQGVIHYDMYLAQENNSTTYMISKIQYPDRYDTTNVMSLLEGVLTEMMAGNNANKLTSRNNSTYKANPSIDFLIENGAVVIRCKAFFEAKTLYVLTLVDRNVGNVEGTFAKFADTFEVMPSSSQQGVTSSSVPSPAGTVSTPSVSAPAGKK